MNHTVDWFERITGFKERSYAETQTKLVVVAGELRSHHSDRSWRVGTLEVPSLFQLRERAKLLATPSRGRMQVSCIQGDVRRLHVMPENRHALFQVASQFNLLEMTGPSVSPEDGVTRYQFDATQGPACAIAAGAGTIYRNYLAPVGGLAGQTTDRQIDCLEDVGIALGNQEGHLWRMQNGYALCTTTGLAAIDRAIGVMSSADLDNLRGRLKIGLQWGVEATEAPASGQLVSQAYCSALPVAYSGVPAPKWSRFATLVLEAAYEATLLAGLLNCRQTGCRSVFLTRLGGGAFGNNHRWINGAISRALTLMRDSELDVRIVSFGPVADDLVELVRPFQP